MSRFLVIDCCTYCLSWTFCRNRLNYFVVTANVIRFCFVRLVTEVSSILHSDPLNPTSQAVCKFIISLFHAPLGGTPIWKCQGCSTPHLGVWSEDGIGLTYRRVLMGVPNWQLTTNFSANCQLTGNPISTLVQCSGWNANRYHLGCTCRNCIVLVVLTNQPWKNLMFFLVLKGLSLI